MSKREVTEVARMQVRNKRMTGSCHSKPSPKERSVADALKDAERQRLELPQIIQVYPRDWDKVILADELIAARRLSHKEAP